MKMHHGIFKRQQSEESELSTSQVVELDDVLFDHDNSKEIRMNDMNSGLYPQLKIKQRNTSL